MDADFTEIIAPPPQAAPAEGTADAKDSLLSMSLDDIIRERDATRRKSGGGGGGAGGKAKERRSLGGAAKSGAPYGAKRAPAPGGAAPAAPGVPGNRVYFGNLSFTTTWKQVKDVVTAAGFHGHRVEIAQKPGAGGESVSAGYGVVTFPSAADAARAIATLNNAELDGRRMFVRADREANLTAPARSGPGPAYVAPQGGYQQQQQQQPRFQPQQQGYGGGGGYPQQGFGGGGYPQQGFGGARPVEVTHTRVVVEKRAPAGGSADAPAKPSIKVAGLPFDINSAELARIFSECGKATATVATHPDGRSRGFGIVAFEGKNAAAAVAAAVREFDGAKVNDRAIRVTAVQQHQ
jgi:RNA recognition motif-containing protein